MSHFRQIRLVLFVISALKKSMNKNRMNRREFLRSSAFAMAGAAIGPDFFNSANALQDKIQGFFRPPKPILSIIIDDNGYSRARTNMFLDLDLPLTFSMLPHLPHTGHLAGKIGDKGHEIMLHQPMEPLDSHFDPGPGAVYVRQDREQIREIISKNLEALPMAVGVNNHMGSRFTARASKMRDALSVVKKRRLFFIDSLTSGRSKAYSCARNLGISAGRRTIFLDNQKNEDAVFAQLQRLFQQAVQHGFAVGIGHPFPQTASGIRRFVRDRGAFFTLAYASGVVRGTRC